MGEFRRHAGSVYKGYPSADHGAPHAVAEFNVASSIAAAKTVFAAPWRSMAITPLDTCGVPEMKLSGDEFATIKKASGDPSVSAILESYAIWKAVPDADQITESTILYDTVAVYLADPNGQPLVNFESLKLTVTDQGITTISPDGKLVRVAVSWKDSPAYRKHLVDVLLSQ